MTMAEQMEAIPQSETSEKCLLGFMLQDSTLAPDIRRAVGVEGFFDPAHQKIAHAIYNLAERNQGGPIPVRDALRDRGQLETIGHGTELQAGLDYLMDLWSEYSFDVSNMAYHVETVRNAGQLRELVRLGAEIRSDARPGANAGELLKRYQHRLFDLDANADHGQGFGEADDAVATARQRARDVAAGVANGGLSTGFGAIDAPTQGMGAGDVWILAAGTSVGKTALALGITANVADTGRGVLYVSCEMDRVAIAYRLLSALSGVPVKRVKTGAFSPDEGAAVDKAEQTIRGWNLALVDKAETVAEIGARARQLAARWPEPPALIVVDHLQLVTPTTGQNRAQEVSGIVWGLKKLATALGVPVLCLSQLNREGLKSGNPPSVLALKESGDIECHASVVLLLHRPNELERGDSGRPLVWARVAKCREGAITPWPTNGYGGIRLRFIPECAHFEALTI